MKFIFRTVLSASLVLSPLALAADNVCIIERDGLKDCYQNTGLDETQFKTFCDSVNKTVPNAPPAKITFKDVCPSSSQGVCQNVFGLQINAFYYQRDAELLGHTKEGCGIHKGTWKSE